MTRSLATWMVLTVCGVFGAAARGADELPAQARLLEAFRKTVKDPYVRRGASVTVEPAIRTESKPEDSAAEILELRDRVGQEVFAGTIFDDETPPPASGPVHEVVKPSRRYDEMVASFLREFAERDTTPTESAAAPVATPADAPPLVEPQPSPLTPPPAPAPSAWSPYAPPAIYPCPPTPTACYPGMPGGYSPTVEALRSAAEQLDSAANMLERQNLYAHADKMRQMATKLRHDARRTPGMTPPAGIAPAAAGPIAPASY